jgi:hypothetical protein
MDWQGYGGTGYFEPQHALAMGAAMVRWMYLLE